MKYKLREFSHYRSTLPVAMVDLHSTLNMVLIPFHLKTMSGIQTSGYIAVSLNFYSVLLVPSL